MSYKYLIRYVPASLLAVLSILATLSVAQVIPAANTRERPLPPALAPTAEQAIAAAAATPHGERLQPPPVVRANPLAPAKPQPASENEDAEMDLLIRQALDQKTDLDVKEAPIREAFEQLSENTGIPIEIEPGTVGLLPYGSKTLVSATIKGRPLRDSLTALLRPIGLRFEVEGGKVVIRPTPPLRRAGQRVTWQELGLLEKLSSSPWSEKLGESLKLQFQDTSGAGADASRETLLRLARGVGAGSAAEVLEQATSQYGWTWYPAGDQIVVLPKTRQIERQLEKRVSVDFDQVSLKDALLDLTRRAAVPLSIDPGALTSASVPNHMADRFSLSVQNTTVRQVLEIIAGQTGLAYFIEPEGVRITTNLLTPTTPSTRPATDVAGLPRTSSVVGQITIPNPNGGPAISFFIRESDLPPELNEARKARIREAISGWRETLQTTAATRPAR